VEADWAVATFTMNWKLTRPEYPVRFEAGEPICLIAPEPRGLVERFRPEIQDISANPGLHEAYRAWSQDRRHFLRHHMARLESSEVPWQKHYFRGASPDGVTAAEHQTKLKVAEFQDGG
jgi:hypothetical protein